MNLCSGCAYAYRVESDHDLTKPSGDGDGIDSTSEAVIAKHNILDRFAYESVMEFAQQHRWFEELDARDALDLAWVLDLIQVLIETEFQGVGDGDGDGKTISITDLRERSRTRLQNHLKKANAGEALNAGLAYFVNPENNLEKFLESLGVGEFSSNLLHHQVTLVDVLTMFSTVDGMREIDAVNAEQWQPVEDHIEEKWRHLMTRLGHHAVTEPGQHDDDEPRQEYDEL